MRRHTVAVIHRDAIAAEGIAAALARYPCLVPIAAASTLIEGERFGRAADAVALDGSIPGAEALAERLRRTAVRVVVLAAKANGDGMTLSTDASIAALVAALVPHAALGSPAAMELTPRQREILALTAQGLAAKQVARCLNISPKTVEQHKTRIFAKLGVPNQTAAVSIALQGGLGDIAVFRQEGTLDASA